MAARPHGSNTGSREWSMGPNEPYWQTNTSFSPPLSSRWDHRSQLEGLPYVSHGGARLSGSSLSSNSKDSRSWVRGDHLPDQHYSPSDDGVSYLSSPSDSFQNEHWTPPLIQGVNVNDYSSGSMREPASGLLTCMRSTEGTSTIPFSLESTSSHSDASEYEPMSKTHMPSHRNSSNRRSFKSKPVHPLSFPNLTPERELRTSVSFANSNKKTMHGESSTLHSDLKSIRMLTEFQLGSGVSEPGDTPQREGLRWSSASSIDFSDASEQLVQESTSFSYSRTEGSKCGLCDRFLSHRSPWSSRRIIRSGDMPIAGVLSCWHVFHADCLEHVTPKSLKHDPPCPLCMKMEDCIPEKRAVCRLKNGISCLRSVGEDGPSRAWSCGQVGDCVEGALHTQTRASLLLLNRNRLKKQLSMKANSGKELPDKLNRSDPFSPQMVFGRRSVDQLVGCSRTSGVVLKRW